MERAQVVLTPTESKRLLSKAVVNLNEVKAALENGTVIIHPSSTTIFMLDELGFQLPQKGVWICGHISPKGLCISRGMIDGVSNIPDYREEKYPFSLVIRRGKLIPFEESALGPALEEMKINDVYIKGVNAIDPKRKVGMLIGSRSTGGSIGLVLKKQKEKKFKVIIPVGLEKRIPIPLEKAMKASLRLKKAQGIPCDIWRLRGKIVSEVEAFRQLCDVEAIPISAGGIAGAEGCIVWVIEGEEEKVEKAYSLCEQIRGCQLPYSLNVYDCSECPNMLCNFVGKKAKKITE